MNRKAGEIVLAGANPSAEEADEGADESSETGCDIVLAHQLVECFAFGDKKGYTQYLKDYMKRYLLVKCKIFCNCCADIQNFM